MCPPPQSYNFWVKLSHAPPRLSFFTFALEGKLNLWSSSFAIAAVNSTVANQHRACAVPSFSNSSAMFRTIAGLWRLEGNLSEPKFSGPACKAGHELWRPNPAERGMREGRHAFSAKHSKWFSLCWPHAVSVTQSLSFYKTALWKCENSFYLVGRIKIGCGPSLAQLSCRESIAVPQKDNVSHGFH